MSELAFIIPAHLRMICFFQTSTSTRRTSKNLPQDSGTISTAIISTKHHPSCLKEIISYRSPTNTSPPPRNPFLLSSEDSWSFKFRSNDFFTVVQPVVFSHNHRIPNMDPTQVSHHSRRIQGMVPRLMCPCRRWKMRSRLHTTIVATKPSDPKPSSS